ncbi:MAG: hypothetical protein KY475_11075 [Planctomycetes bacterium]|nr:hypothetical protein [Planctomycetota bacterium]
MGLLNTFDQDDGNRKLCSLYLSLMDRMGVELLRFGDAETRLTGIGVAQGPPLGIRVRDRNSLHRLDRDPDRAGPRLYDRTIEILRMRHYSRRTEEAYAGWIRRYVEEISGLLSAKSERERGSADRTDRSAGPPKSFASIARRRHNPG